LAGIDLNNAVVELSKKPDGFTVAQLAETVRQRSGQDAAAYSARNAAHDLAKMIGKMLVRCIERSRRYAVDPPGLRTLCACLLAARKIIKPPLAGVAGPRCRPPKVVAPLDQHNVALRDELQRTFQPKSVSWQKYQVSCAAGRAEPDGQLAGNCRRAKQSMYAPRHYLARHTQRSRRPGTPPSGGAPK
jgi:hypothetical protein